MYVSISGVIVFSPKMLSGTQFGIGVATRPAPSGVPHTSFPVASCPAGPSALPIFSAL